jgi:hypothetical protein
MSTLHPHTAVPSRVSQLLTYDRAAKLAPLEGTEMPSPFFAFCVGYTQPTPNMSSSLMGHRVQLLLWNKTRIGAPNEIRNGSHRSSQGEKQESASPQSNLDSSFTPVIAQESAARAGHCAFVSLSSAAHIRNASHCCSQGEKQESASPQSNFDLSFTPIIAQENAPWAGHCASVSLSSAAHSRGDRQSDLHAC